MNEPIRWLLIEGVAALFGAGGLYLLVGLCFKIAGSAAPFAWREAFDPLGWLYGGLVIGVQSAVRLLGSQAGRPPSIWMKSTAGVIAVALLVIGYLERGAI